MTTLDQVSNQILKQSSEIAALTESVKSAHKRIDENDRITSGIHKLAANVEGLAIQVKLLTESMEYSISRLENSIKSQGERIGTLEKEPSAKWKNFAAQITSLVVAAIFGLVAAKFIGR